MNDMRVFAKKVVTLDTNDMMSSRFDILKSITVTRSNTPTQLSSYPQSIVASLKQLPLRSIKSTLNNLLQILVPNPFHLPHYKPLPCLPPVTSRLLAMNLPSMSRQRRALSKRRPTLTSKRPQLFMHSQHMRLEKAFPSKVTPTLLALVRSNLSMHHPHMSIPIRASPKPSLTLRASIRPSARPSMTHPTFLPLRRTIRGHA